MKNFILSIFFIAALAALAGCNTDPGPDSISSHAGSGGGAITSCTTVCHIPGGTVGPDPLSTNGSGTAGKHIAHVSSRGMSCTKCHNGYAANPSHFNGVVNSKGNGPAPVFFDATNPSGVWSFTTPSGPGTCSSTICHRSLTPDWYGTAVPPQDTVCSNCHSAFINLRRAVMGAAGDFASNPSVTASHVAGGGDPSSGQCTVCHDQSLHMGGTVRLSHADTGTRIDLDPANPATLEPFCLSCHDMDGALATALTASALSPFNDGVTLGAMPYMASTTVASAWAGSSMHRSRGLTCAGTGRPGTGCHGRNGAINAHGSVNKGLLTNAMNFQIPLETQAIYSAGRSVAASYDPNNYKLCFDCHAGYPAVTKEVVFGFFSGGVYDYFEEPTPFGSVRQGSRFRDYAVPPFGTPSYSDTMWGYTYMALHNYHLIGFESRPLVTPPGINALQWKYRGDPARIGRITCTACHSVHGTVNATIRSTYEELGLTQSSIGADTFVTIGTPSMISQPLNCAIDCHSLAGQTSYWNIPARE